MVYYHISRTVIVSANVTFDSFRHSFCLSFRNSETHSNHVPMHMIPVASIMASITGAARL